MEVAMEEFIHRHLEKAFREHFGKVFSSEDIKKIVLAMFPKFNQGSIIPADHAEHDNPKHTGQCTKCAERKYQIFDTLVEGEGKPDDGRYRVRMFES